MKVGIPAHTTVETGIKVWLGATFGLIIGMSRADILSVDAFLTIVGGFGGAASAVIGAIWLEHRNESRARTIDRKQVIEQCEFVSGWMKKHLAAARAATNFEDKIESLTSIRAGWNELQHMLDEALKSSRHFKFKERSSMASMIEDVVGCQDKFARWREDEIEIRVNEPGSANHTTAQSRLISLLDLTDIIVERIDLLHTQLLR